jgi:hypothetical protein
VEVTVNLYGDLRKYLQPGKGSTFTLGVAPGMAVKDVLDHLGVPADFPVAIVVNGVHRYRQWQLADHDVLSLFSLGAFAQQQPDS